jgi:UDP-N-acetylmuramate--alanine ligase
MDLNRIHNIFFLGIGGIGMSALARHFHARGVVVSGYDRTQTALTLALQQQGMTIFHEDNPEVIPTQCDMVIYTPAVPKSTAIYQEVIKKGLPLKKRAEVLGMISAQIPTIAVAGTHGKTTISTMIAHILRTAGIDFTAFLGGISANYHTNYLGCDNPQWIVAEADEYDRSFLQLSPGIAVISSMDPDHLDIYGNAETMKESFKLFAEKVNNTGTLVLKKGIGLDQTTKAQVLTYHLTETASYYATRIRVENNRYTASVQGEINAENVHIGLPGRHNLENALAAIAVARRLGIDKETIASALSTFKGVKRRFETVFNSEPCVFIDDYAHHPEELSACIGAARELYPGRKICGVFQPHLFSRTRDLAAGFAESLAKLDELLLMEIYPARELPIEGISSEWLLELIPMENKKLVSGQELLQRVQKAPPEVLLTMGAGDIDLLVDPLRQILKEKLQ